MGKGLAFTRKLSIEQLEVPHYKIFTEVLTYEGSIAGKKNVFFNWLDTIIVLIPIKVNWLILLF